MAHSAPAAGRKRPKPPDGTSLPGGPYNITAFVNPSTVHLRQACQQVLDAQRLVFVCGEFTGLPSGTPAGSCAFGDDESCQCVSTAKAPEGTKFNLRLEHNMATVLTRVKLGDLPIVVAKRSTNKSTHVVTWTEPSKPLFSYPEDEGALAGNELRWTKVGRNVSEVAALSNAFQQCREKHSFSWYNSYMFSLGTSWGNMDAETMTTLNDAIGNAGLLVQQAAALYAAQQFNNDETVAAYERSAFTADLVITKKARRMLQAPAAAQPPTVPKAKAKAPAAAQPPTVPTATAAQVQVYTTTGRAVQLLVTNQLFYKGSIQPGAAEAWRHTISTDPVISLSLGTSVDFGILMAHTISAQHIAIWEAQEHVKLLRYFVALDECFDSYYQEFRWQDMRHVTDDGLKAFLALITIVPTNVDRRYKGSHRETQHEPPRATTTGSGETLFTATFSCPLVDSYQFHWCELLVTLNDLCDDTGVARDPLPDSLLGLPDHIAPLDKVDADLLLLTKAAVAVSEILCAQGLEKVVLTEKAEFVANVTETMPIGWYRQGMFTLPFKEVTVRFAEDGEVIKAKGVVRVVLGFRPRQGDAFSGNAMDAMDTPELEMRFLWSWTLVPVDPTIEMKQKKALFKVATDATTQLKRMFAPILRFNEDNVLRTGKRETKYSLLFPGTNAYLQAVFDAASLDYRASADRSELRPYGNTVETVLYPFVLPLLELHGYSIPLRRRTRFPFGDVYEAEQILRLVTVKQMLAQPSTIRTTASIGHIISWSRSLPYLAGHPLVWRLARIIIDTKTQLFAGTMRFQVRPDEWGDTPGSPLDVPPPQVQGRLGRQARDWNRVTMGARWPVSPTFMLMMYVKLSSYLINEDTARVPVADEENLLLTPLAKNGRLANKWRDSATKCAALLRTLASQAQVPDRVSYWTRYLSSNVTTDDKCTGIYFPRSVCGQGHPNPPVLCPFEHADFELMFGLAELGMTREQSRVGVGTMRMMSALRADTPQAKILWDKLKSYKESIELGPVWIPTVPPALPTCNQTRGKDRRRWGQHPDNLGMKLITVPGDLLVALGTTRENFSGMVVGAYPGRAGAQPPVPATTSAAPSAPKATQLPKAAVTPSPKAPEQLPKAAVTQSPKAPTEQPPEALATQSPEAEEEAPKDAWLTDEEEVPPMSQAAALMPKETAPALQAKATTATPLGQNVTCKHYRKVGGLPMLVAQMGTSTTVIEAVPHASTGWAQLNAEARAGMEPSKDSKVWLCTDRPIAGASNRKWLDTTPVNVDEVQFGKVSEAADVLVQKAKGNANFRDTNDFWKPEITVNGQQCLGPLLRMMVRDTEKDVLDILEEQLLGRMKEMVKHGERTLMAMWCDRRNALEYVQTNQKFDILPMHDGENGFRDLHASWFHLGSKKGRKTHTLKQHADHGFILFPTQSGEEGVDMARWKITDAGNEGYYLGARTLVECFTERWRIQTPFLRVARWTPGLHPDNWSAGSWVEDSFNMVARFTAHADTDPVMKRFQELHDAAVSHVTKRLTTVMQTKSATDEPVNTSGNFEECCSSMLTEAYNEAIVQEREHKRQEVLYHAVSIQKWNLFAVFVEQIVQNTMGVYGANATERLMAYPATFGHLANQDLMPRLAQVFERVLSISCWRDSGVFGTADALCLKVMSALINTPLKRTQIGYEEEATQKSFTEAFENNDYFLTPLYKGWSTHEANRMTGGLNRLGRTANDNVRPSFRISQLRVSQITEALLALRYAMQLLKSDDSVTGRALQQNKPYDSEQVVVEIIKKSMEMNEIWANYPVPHSGRGGAMLEYTRYSKEYWEPFGNVAKGKGRHEEWFNFHTFMQGSGSEGWNLEPNKSKGPGWQKRGEIDKYLAIGYRVAFATYGFLDYIHKMDGMEIIALGQLLKFVYPCEGSPATNMVTAPTEQQISYHVRYFGAGNGPCTRLRKAMLELHATMAQATPSRKSQGLTDFIKAAGDPPVSFHYRRGVRVTDPKSSQLGLTKAGVLSALAIEKALVAIMENGLGKGDATHAPPPQTHTVGTVPDSPAVVAAKHVAATPTMAQVVAAPVKKVTVVKTAIVKKPTGTVTGKAATGGVKAVPTVAPTKKASGGTQSLPAPKTKSGGLKRSAVLAPNPFTNVAPKTSDDGWTEVDGTKKKKKKKR